MVTVVNNPGPTSDNGNSGLTAVLMVLVVLVLVALFVWPGFITGGMNGTTNGPDTTNINVSIPTSGGTDESGE